MLSCRRSDSSPAPGRHSGRIPEWHTETRTDMRTVWQPNWVDEASSSLLLLLELLGRAAEDWSAGRPGVQPPELRDIPSTGSFRKNKSEHTGGLLWGFLVENSPSSHCFLHRKQAHRVWPLAPLQKKKVNKLKVSFLTFIYFFYLAQINLVLLAVKFGTNRIIALRVPTLLFCRSWKCLRDFTSCRTCAVEACSTAHARWDIPVIKHRSCSSYLLTYLWRYFFYLNKIKHVICVQK